MVLGPPGDWGPEAWIQIATLPEAERQSGPRGSWAMIATLSLQTAIRAPAFGALENRVGAPIA